MTDAQLQHAVWTVEEAAAYLRVSEWQMYEECRRGNIPHMRVGRRIRIDREVVVGLLRGEQARGQQSRSARGRKAKPQR